MNNRVLIPVFAQVILKQGGVGLGILFSYSGLGAVIGAMLVAVMSRSGPNRFVIWVMSVYTLVVAGSTPIGNLYAGLADDYIGARFGFATCGVVVVLFLIPMYLYKLKKRHVNGLVKETPLQPGP